MSRAVLREALEGPPERWSYFTDNSPDAGLFGTLAPLSAADASRPVAGTSVAAHVHHVAWARQTVEAHALAGEEAFGGALVAVAHIAYHLGAIRQKIAVVRTP